jgi:quinolinate synthase
MNYLSHKQSLPLEQKSIHFYNSSSNESKNNVDLICTSNAGLEIRSLVEEESNRLKK